MPRDWERLYREADAAGFRLEMVHGIPVWEPLPVLRHQEAVARIYGSIRPLPTDAGNPCACYAALDVLVRFPDGSLKRPDISVFCRRPDEEDSAITLLPEAVIEVISEDYEAKDLLIGVPFYQQIGVKDIVVLDPRTGEVRHWQRGTEQPVQQTPASLTFLSGCACIV